MRVFIACFIIILFGSICFQIQAQEIRSTNGLAQAQPEYSFQHSQDYDFLQELKEDQEETKNRLVLLPIIFSSPDTRYAFGVLPQYLFYVTPDSRPSRIRMDAFYTQEKQFNVTLRPQVWLKHNQYLLAGKFVYKKWPTTFYGIGGNASEDGKEKFTEQLFNFSAEAQRQLRPGLFTGLIYSVRSGRIKEVVEGGSLARGVITGSGTGVASGLGLIISKDTRDNINFPSSGSLHRFSATFYGSMLGSDYSLSSYALDLRQYLGLGGPHVLAFQAEMVMGFGDIPFRMLAGVGDPLRGYGSTRYIDNNRIILQAEYRVVPIWWRLGFTAFCGIGDVAHRPGDFKFKNPKWAVGLGIRFLIYAQEKITIRQDFAFGKGSSGDYLDLNEAF